MAPLIALTAYNRLLETEVGRRIYAVMQPDYGDRVVEAGGLPVMVGELDPALAPAICDRVDGLVLTGGGDVCPARYGGGDHEHVYGTSAARDAFESALLAAAEARELPTLAICRGIQITGVHFGAGLLAHLPDEGYADLHLKGGYTAKHEVSVEPSSRLANILGDTRAVTISAHHQALADAPPGFKVAARAEDGVIEAIESPDHPWLVAAVQWHPEKEEATRQPLFEALVTAAGNRRANS